MLICKLLLLLVFSLGKATADDLLKSVQAQLVQVERVAGHFRQEKQLKFLRKPLVSEGEFIYQSHRGLVWATQSPVASILLVNDNRLLSNQGEQALPPSFARVFQAMLGGDLGRLQDDFSIDGAINAAQWHLQLTPKDPLMAKVIHSLSLAGDNEVRALVILETSGNQSKISFEQISHPLQLSPEQAANFERLSP